MNKKSIVLLGVAGFLLLSVIIVAGSMMSVYNRASSLDELYKSKIKVNMTVLDNTKKKISQTAQVPVAQLAALKDLYVSNSGARTPNTDKLLANFVREVAPNVDQSTFKNLQNIITSSRDEWTFNQKELVDVANQHNQMLRPLISGSFLRFCGFKRIDAQIVTSDSVEAAFQSGKDNDTQVFAK